MGNEKETGKGKIKKGLRKVVQLVLNPRLLLCFGIAWFITNGWSYLVFGLGTYLDIGWLAAIGGAYLAFLWLPISPEKLVTFAIAILLLRLIFPNDQKTLAVLKEWHIKAKNAFKMRKKSKKSKNKGKTNDSDNTDNI